MKKKQRQQWEKWISLWMVVALLLSIVPMPANQVEAASTEPITIAQGDNTIGVTNTFDAQYWNIGYDATLASNRIQLTPAEGGKKGFAYFKDSIRLSNDLSFNAKYTVNISDSDYAGADGIAFVIQSNSNTAGAEGEGIGYSGITPSVVVEIDTYKNTADATVVRLRL
ncbi:L-type lectin-domain containing protein [Halolactibacillus sp. JCM 19043]|uniref:L-type lectin-domain containing protein n=1 Tax=Halolactibacillus sp. JCM 19043 TaxID=1460638 RepID=UPI000782DD1C|nr:L-type lectin-domain containing protein [Halolactibacillus sp. JCM 19043]